MRPFGLGDLPELVASYLWVFGFGFLAGSLLTVGLFLAT